MRVFSLELSDKPLPNFELSTYARELEISNSKGVFMRDTLPRQPLSVECGIINLNTSSQRGSHWVCYYRNKSNRIYFDSYGQITPVEIQRYLKTGIEFAVVRKLYREIQILYRLQIHRCVVTFAYSFESFKRF